MSKYDREYQRAWYQENREKVCEQRREIYRAKRKLLVKARLESQGNRCAICGTVAPGERGWHFDHDARCCKYRDVRRRCGGCERGILCSLCNVAIGMLQEDAQVMRAAADYIETWARE